VGAYLNKRAGMLKNFFFVSQRMKKGENTTPEERPSYGRGVFGTSGSTKLADICQSNFMNVNKRPNL